MAESESVASLLPRRRGEGRQNVREYSIWQSSISLGTKLVRLTAPESEIVRLSVKQPVGERASNK